MKIIQQAKDTYLPWETVKFKKKKHKKSKWMTYGILNSINKILTKLDHYGVNESAKRLIHSY